MILWTVLGWLLALAPVALVIVYRRALRRERKARAMDAVVGASKQRGQSRSVLIQRAIEEDLARRRREVVERNGAAQARGRR